MTDQDQRRRNEAAVRAAFAAVGAGDAAAQMANYTDDAVMEMPYADPPARVEGRSTIGERLAAAFEVFRFTLTIEQITECRDPDELVVEFTGAGTVVTTGKPYTNRYIARFRFRDGLICFQREYYDPTAAARALQPD